MEVRKFCKLGQGQRIKQWGDPRTKNIFVSIGGMGTAYCSPWEWEELQQPSISVWGLRSNTGVEGLTLRSNTGVVYGVDLVWAAQIDDGFGGVHIDYFSIKFRVQRARGIWDTFIWVG